jgi:hypothetical protein
MNETEEDELREDLKFGWRIFETPEVEFYVTHEDEDVYIDEDGDRREEPVYFNDHMDANKAFSELLKEKKENSETEDEAEAEVRREEEEYETDWGSSEVERKIDGFWYLTYQESEPTGEKRRWAVFYPDRDFHLGPDGMLTRRPFWFDSEDEAVEAYEKHLERTEEVGITRRLPLSFVYIVFVLPIKALGALVHALALPARIAWTLMSTQASLFGFTKGGRVPYVAKALVLLTVAAFAFWVDPLLCAFVLLYIVSSIVYWGSPYQPYGSVTRPRWTRRDEDTVTSEPPGSHEESDFEPTTTRQPKTDSDSEAYEEKTDFES